MTSPVFSPAEISLKKKIQEYGRFSHQPYVHQLLQLHHNCLRVAIVATDNTETVHSSSLLMNVLAECGVIPALGS